MGRARMMAVIAGWLVIAGAAPAQPQFRWQSGQVLNYRSTQTTTETETIAGDVTNSTLSVTQVKRWEVVAVDAAGTATIRQSLTALRIEKRQGDVAAVFDSAAPAQSDPEMKRQLERFVKVPVAVLRVDGRGRVVAVQESKQGGAERYENELPFAFVLPEQGLQAGQGWERTYSITLAPPLGTGEQYPAVQGCQCAAVSDGVARITFTTTLKSPPEAAGDRVPLLRFLPQGEVSFDVATGVLRKARLIVDQEVQDHQGAGSRYRVQMTATEELMP